MLSGELTYHLIVVVLLTPVVAAYVLIRYRSAVLRGMQAETFEAVLAPPAVVDRTGATRSPGVDLPSALAWERTARRRIATAYLMSVGIVALGLAALWLAQSDVSFSGRRVTLVGGVLLSAAVPMIAVSLAMPFPRASGWWLVLLLAGATLAVGVSIVEARAVGAPQLMAFVAFFALADLSLMGGTVSMALSTLRGTGPGVGEVLVLLSHILTAPLFLVLATGGRRLRGIAPVTLAGLLVFGLAPLGGARLFTFAANVNQVGLLLRLFRSTTVAFNGGFVLLALPTTWVALRRIRSLARRHAAKRFSDAQLVARTWWLMFVASYALEMMATSPNPWWPLACGAAAYLPFARLNSFFLARARLDRGRPPARTLLLLRVFGNTARTERLFDRVAARWRLFGPVTVIGAPDVVARTVDPGDFLRFTTGRTADVFVKSQVDLDARLASLDLTPDPDGRYRVNALCCRHSTWQATVVELMQRADAVIMDVRGVTVERLGCQFELEQLAARLPLMKVVLVVDGTTDLTVIERAMGNRHEEARLVRVERNATRETDRVFEALLAAAE